MSVFPTILSFSRKVTSVQMSCSLFTVSCLQPTAQQVTLSITHCQWVSKVTLTWFWNIKSKPRVIWTLRHLIRMMRTNDLANNFKNVDNVWQCLIFESFYHFGHFWQYLTILQSLTTLDKTTTRYLEKYIQRATLDTCDLSDVCS